MLDPAQSDQTQLSDIAWWSWFWFWQFTIWSDTSRSYTIWPATIVYDIMWWSWFRSSSTIWSDTSRSYTMPKCHKASSRRVTASLTSHFVLTQGIDVQQSEKGMKHTLAYMHIQQSNNHTKSVTQCTRRYNRTIAQSHKGLRLQPHKGLKWTFVQTHKRIQRGRIKGGSATAKENWGR